MKLDYMEIYEKIVDVLTNPLSRVKFEYFRKTWCDQDRDPSKEGVTSSRIVIAASCYAM